MAEILRHSRSMTTHINSKLELKASAGLKGMFMKPVGSSTLMMKFALNHNHSCVSADCNAA